MLQKRIRKKNAFVSLQMIIYLHNIKWENDNTRIIILILHL